ncbi:hypothetical protein E4U13_007851 [Claviceps humidiphila]|uniref:Glucose-methanol-choline oxidoreductase N-terminal domain-containing protein n=1 Tax=Claviceps humidiphila TaxID=1294629 RepID=A0A9P7TZH4_9HYPO|nr:hypothetical protein E4U13_007851 [Claviceps humidiphila]
MLLPWFVGGGILAALAGPTRATIVTDQAAAVSGKTFDYVIVGAGLSGITLSGRGYSVLIIEAGPDGSWNPAVFNADSRAYPATYCNWNYPVHDNDGVKLNKTIDAGACIGGSTVYL